MNCLDYRESVQRWFDGDLSGPHQPEADLHLKDCPACREWRQAAQRLLEGLRLQPLPQPPTGLAERIVSQVILEQRRHLRTRWGLVTFAAAASLLLGVWWARRGQDTAVPSRVDPDVAKLQQAAPQLPLPSLNRQVQEASQAVVSLTMRAADETASQGRLLLPATLPTPSAPEMHVEQSTFPGSAQPLLDITEGMGVGLEPVTTSARRAFDLFVRDLPTKEPARKSGL